MQVPASTPLSVAAGRDRFLAFLVYFLLVALFLAASVALVAIAYQDRSNPSTAVTVSRELYPIPPLMFCSQSWIDIQRVNVSCTPAANCMFQSYCVGCSTSNITTVSNGTGVITTSTTVNNVTGGGKTGQVTFDPVNGYTYPTYPIVVTPVTITSSLTANSTVTTITQQASGTACWVFIQPTRPLLLTDVATTKNFFTGGVHYDCAKETVTTTTTTTTQSAPTFAPTSQATGTNAPSNQSSVINSNSTVPTLHVLRYVPVDYCRNVVMEVYVTDCLSSTRLPTVDEVLACKNAMFGPLLEPGYYDGHITATKTIPLFDNAYFNYTFADVSRLPGSIYETQYVFNGNNSPTSSVYAALNPDSTRAGSQGFLMQVGNSGGTITVLTAVDPVNPVQLIGTIGGFWSFVGLLFGMCFTTTVQYATLTIIEPILSCFRSSSSSSSSPQTPTVDLEVNDKSDFVTSSSSEKDKDKDKDKDTDMEMVVHTVDTPPTEN